MPEPSIDACVEMQAYLASLSSEQFEELLEEVRRRGAEIRGVDVDAFIDDVERFANEGSTR